MGRGAAGGDFELADFASCVETIGAGHVEVHEDEVVGVLFPKRYRLLPVGGGVGVVAHFLQEEEKDAAVDLVVVGDEDAKGMARGEGGIESAVVAGPIGDEIFEGTTDQLTQHGEAGRVGDGAGEGGAVGGGMRAIDGDDEMAREGSQLDSKTLDIGVAIVVDDCKMGIAGLEVAGAGDDANAGTEAGSEGLESAGHGVAAADEKDVTGRLLDGTGAGLETEDAGKLGAPARLADKGNIASHKVEKAAGNEEAQAGAAVAARDSLVALGKGTKDAGLLEGGHADTGILDAQGNREAAIGPGLAAGEAHTDLALVGELDGVGEKVEEDLPEASAIGEALRREGWLGLQAEQEALAAGPLGDEKEAIGSELNEVAGSLLELHLGGFEL